MLWLSSPSSSNKEDVKGDNHDIHTVQGELAMAWQSLRDGCLEVERLKECVAAAKTTLGAADGEAAGARAAVVATRTELIGELIFFASFAELSFVLILTLHFSQ
jgi:hypothetical protein